MDILFTITPVVGGASVILTNTSTDYTRGSGVLKLKFTGTITGVVGDYTLSGANLSAFDAKTPITITVAALTASVYSILPDDFYRVQLTDTTIDLESPIYPLGSCQYVQNLLHAKIVHTDRIIGFIEKANLHSMFIHLHVLEVLGDNPPISLEDTYVARLRYLKTI
jgi:hypothetical protein